MNALFWNNAKPQEMQSLQIPVSTLDEHTTFLHLLPAPNMSDDLLQSLEVISPLGEKTTATQLLTRPLSLGSNFTEDNVTIQLQISKEAPPSVQMHDLYFTFTTSSENSGLLQTNTPSVFTGTPNPTPILTPTPTLTATSAPVTTSPPNLLRKSTTAPHQTIHTSKSTISPRDPSPATSHVEKTPKHSSVLGAHISTPWSGSTFLNSFVTPWTICLFVTILFVILWIYRKKQHTPVANR